MTFRSQGGTLSDPSNFGWDPLEQRLDLQNLREQEFSRRFPKFDPIFHNVANGDALMFRMSVRFFQEVTLRLFHCHSARI